MKETITIMIKSNGQTFTIENGNGKVTLNGYQLTVDHWQQVLVGQKVVLINVNHPETQLWIQSIHLSGDSNGFLTHLMVDNVHLFAPGYSIQVMEKVKPNVYKIKPYEKTNTVKRTFFIGEISLPSGQILDLTKSTWVTLVQPGMTIILNCDGKKYTITGNGKRVLWNGYKITVRDWQNILAGKRVKLVKESSPYVTIIMESKFSPAEPNGFFTNLKFGSAYIFVGSRFEIQIQIRQTKYIKEPETRYQKPEVVETSFTGAITISEGRTIDLTRATWINTLTHIKQTITIIIKSNGQSFTIHNGQGYITLNGHQLSKSDWHLVLTGQKVVLFNPKQPNNKPLWIQSIHQPGSSKSFLSNLMVDNVLLFGPGYSIQVTVQKKPTVIIVKPGEKTVEPGYRTGYGPGYGQSFFTGEIPLPGGQLLDLRKSTWVTRVLSGVTINLNCNGKRYAITGNGRRILWNGYRITARDWQNLLDGKRVKLVKESNPYVTIIMESRFSPAEPNGFFNHLMFDGVYLFRERYEIIVVVQSVRVIDKTWYNMGNWQNLNNWWSQMNLENGCQYCKNLAGGHWMKIPKVAGIQIGHIVDKIQDKIIKFKNWMRPGKPSYRKQRHEKPTYRKNTYRKQPYGKPKYGKHKYGK